MQLYWPLVSNLRLACHGSRGSRATWILVIIGWNGREN